MSKQVKVYKADAYKHGNLGSFGKAQYMLIRQWNFPHIYDRTKDVLRTADHDRLKQWDYEKTRDCFKRYGIRELDLDGWAVEANPETILQFLIDVMKADPEENWTGFRILGTVNPSNGYPVWSFQLFANKTGVKVYSGHNAPNVDTTSDNRVNHIWRDWM